VNILQALGQAGGFTENANRETIRIIRNENGTARIYQLNLLEDNSISSANFFLQPNDIVLVNPVRAITQRQERLALFGLGMSIISSISFIVWQIVRNP
jgi:polysaccharide export outer membrane protein